MSAGAKSGDQQRGRVGIRGYTLPPPLTLGGRVRGAQLPANTEVRITGVSNSSAGAGNAHPVVTARGLVIGYQPAIRTTATIAYRCAGGNYSVDHSALKQLNLHIGPRIPGIGPGDGLVAAHTPDLTAIGRSDR